MSIFARLPFDSLRLGLLACLCGIAAFSASAFAEQQSNFPLVDGDRQATIVYPDDPTNHERDAVADLIRYVEKSTGRKLASVSEAAFAPDDASYPVYVGRCQKTSQELGARLEGIDRHGFTLVVQPRQCFLVGSEDFGTYWAVCELLENEVGVRWLIPTELGEDVPAHERIVLQPQQTLHEPTILSRSWSGVTYTEANTRWTWRMRVAGRYSFHHNLHRIFDPDAVFDEHPEYFPMRAGKRYRPPGGGRGNWQPCMSNPDTAKVAAETIVRYFNEHPEAESYSLGLNDAGGFCECPECRAKVRPELHYGGYPSPNTYLVFPWVSAIAERVGQAHPSKILGCFAYLSYCAPPKEIAIDRSLMPYITFSILDLHVPSNRKATFELMEKLGRQTDQIGIYDYGYGMGSVMPRIYTPLVQQTLLHGLTCNLKGVYAEMYPNFGLDGPRLYLTAKLWWNPRLDFQTAYDEWHQRMFREAADPMRSHFRRCREALLSYKDYEKWSTVYRPYVPRTPQFAVFTPDVVEACTTDLNRAAELAQSDIVRQRVELYRRTWQVSVHFVDGYWAGRGAEHLIEAEGPLEQIAAALSRMPEANELADYEQALRRLQAEQPLALFPRAVESYYYKRKAAQRDHTPEDRDRYYMPPESLNDGAIAKLARRIVDRMKAADGASTLDDQAATTEIADVLGPAQNAAHHELIDKISRAAQRYAKGEVPR